MLDQAEAVINENSSEAITILDSISNDGLSRSQRMRRLLLLTNAQNKCDTVFRSDSIQKLLVNYYESHGTANERMLAHYLLGRAYQDIHDYPNALNNYQKAANHADTTDIECDYALLSRVYGQMSDVFYHQNLIEEDLKFNNLAIRYSWKAKDTLAAILGMAGNIAAYKGMGKPDSALSICEQASVLARRYGYKNLSAGILGGAITILVEKDSLNKAKTFMDIYESESGFFDENHDIVKGREVYYYPKGRYYLAVGKYDSAEHYFRKELREGKDFNNQNAASRGLALLFQKTHRPDSAAKYALYSYTMNDSVYATSGTDSDSYEDWKNNFLQVFGASEQYNISKENARVLSDNINQELTFVGHSLGGGMAATNAYKTGRSAMTFNAAWVSPLTIAPWNRKGAKIDAYVHVRDELNIFQQTHMGVRANGNIHWRNKNRAIMGHSIKNFYPSGKEMIMQKSKNAQSQYTLNTNNILFGF